VCEGNELMSEPIKITGPDLATEGIPRDALKSDVPVIGHVDGKPVVVLETSDGPRAVGGKCTHYGGALGDGLCVDGEIRCPLHHAAFDLATGEAVSGPALNPIPVYDTTQRDGLVFVTGPVEPPDLKVQPFKAPDSVIIVGSGAAGAVAAEAIRRNGYAGPISLIGEEAPVDRPNVSKDYLAGTAPEEWMPLRSEGFYTDAGIDLITGETVTSIDPDGHKVHLSDGRTLSYGALLLATGATPRRLPVPGADMPHVHCLRTLADSRNIIAKFDDGTRAVVIGAGFIGLEVAASLRQRNIDVTVVAPEETPLGLLVGRELGQYVVDLHRSHGVKFQLGRRVTAITEDTVKLDDGTSINANLVIMGVGVDPNVALAEAAGLSIDDGIVVDDRLRTSAPDIWAAGDTARYPNPDGGHMRVEHWVPAQRQGQTAARNILGHDVAFAVPPFFWSEHYGIRINVVGSLDGWDENVVSGDTEKPDVLVGYRKEGTTMAVASINRDRDNLRAEVALETSDEQGLNNLTRE